MKTKYPFADLHEDYIEYSRLKALKSGDIDWKEISENYPLEKDITYLNSGTEGSMSKQVLKQYKSCLYKWAGNPSYYFAFDKTMQDWQKNNRAKIAEFISTTLDNICITDNTTEGIGMVLMGLDFKEDDEVIISLHAYPSLVSTLNVLCDKYKIKYKVVPIPTSMKSKEEIVNAFARAFTNKTKAICISHVTYTTGLLMPVNEICKLAQEKNIISLIDGAHALGMIPLNMNEINCDFYATAGHKWLNGPPGTGVLYIKNAKENKYNLKPILSELYGFETSYTITEMLQIRGCNNAPGFTALTGAIQLNESIGKENIYHRIIQLNTYAKEKITKEWGEQALFSPYGKNQEELYSGIATFIPSRDNNKKYDKGFITKLSSQLIDDYKIWIRYINFIDDPSVTEKKTWGIRVSTNLFNTFKEIDLLIDTIRKLV